MFLRNVQSLVVKTFISMRCTEMVHFFRPSVNIFSKSYTANNTRLNPRHQLIFLQVSCACFKQKSLLCFIVGPAKSYSVQYWNALLFQAKRRHDHPHQPNWGNSAKGKVFVSAVKSAYKSFCAKSSPPDIWRVNAIVLLQEGHDLWT